MGHRVGIKRRPRANIDRRPQGLGLRPPPLFHVSERLPQHLCVARAGADCWEETAVHWRRSAAVVTRHLIGHRCGSRGIGIVMTYAVDTSVCERALQNYEPRNEANNEARSFAVRLRPNEPPEDGATLVNAMGNLLLRTLMTICELGKEWRDATKIPAEERWLRSGAPRARRGAMSRPRGRRLACRSPVRESRTYALPVEARCAQVCVRSSQVSLILR